MTDDAELPTWHGPRDGSGCDNPDCDAADLYVRVLSREEIERVYLDPERLPMWPLPEQYTHMCTRCGQAYAGYAELTGFGFDTDLDGRPDVPIDDWDWDPETAWDASVREAVIDFAESAPEDATVDQIVEGVDQHVPGADAGLARDLLGEADTHVTADSAAQFV